MKLARIALRNIGRNRRRSALSATATAIATMSMVALASYINGMRLDMQANVSDLVTGHVQVRHRDYSRYERLNPLHLRVERPEDLLARLDAEPRGRRLPWPGCRCRWGCSAGEETTGRHGPRDGHAAGERVHARGTARARGAAACGRRERGRRSALRLAS